MSKQGQSLIKMGIKKTPGILVLSRNSGKSKHIMVLVLIEGNLSKEVLPLSDPKIRDADDYSGTPVSQALFLVKASFSFL